MASLERYLPTLNEFEAASIGGGRSSAELKNLTLRPFKVRVPAHPHMLLPGLVQHAYPAAPDLRLRRSAYLSARKTSCSLNDPETPPGAKLKLVSRYGDAAALDIDTILTYGRPRAMALDLVNGASMLELCFGIKVQDSLRKKFASRLGLAGGTAALEVSRIVDLRDNMAAKAAVLSNPYVDPQDRRLLWFRLQSVPDWKIPLVHANASTTLYPVNRLWLLALDCTDGKYKKRIDLTSVPGLWPEGSPKSLKSGSLDHGFEALPSDSAFLVHVHWGDLGPMAPTADWLLNSNAVVRIDRKSGTVTEGPGLTADFHMQYLGGAPVPLGTSIGDSFFVVAPGRKPQDEEFSTSKLLWQVRPDGTLKQLTKPGRRPEQSPFDAEDREIGVLRNDNGRLLVGDQAGHYGYYNPETELWEAAGEAGDMAKRAFDAERANLHAMIFPQHILQMNDGSEDVAFDSQHPKPGCLNLAWKGRRLELPVSTKVPDSYAATFSMGATSATTEKVETLQEMITRGRWVTVILNQTEEHLVLGLCKADTARYTYQQQYHRCLPFVWLLEKDKLRDAIRKLDSSDR